jgi:hypothetical protein
MLCTDAPESNRPFTRCQHLRRPIRCAEGLEVVGTSCMACDIQQVCHLSYVCIVSF